MNSDEETALVNAVQISSRIYETIFSEIFQSVNFLSVSWPEYSFIKHLQWLFSC